MVIIVSLIGAVLSRKFFFILMHLKLLVRKVLSIHNIYQWRGSWCINSWKNKTYCTTFLVEIHFLQPTLINMCFLMCLPLTFSFPNTFIIMFCHKRGLQIMQCSNHSILLFVPNQVTSLNPRINYTNSQPLKWSMHTISISLSILGSQNWVNRKNLKKKNSSSHLVME